MVTCTATLNTLASDYVGLGSWVGLATASPGTTSTATGEASAGSPAYARLTTTWGASSTSGVQTGTAVTLNVSAATYTYMLLASSSSGANMQDNASITSVVMGAQGQIVVTPTFTQT
jgi:hypothetical protein